MRYWGYHLILDCSKCIPRSIRDRQNIEAFAKNLVHRINMVPFGEPQIQHFGSGNKAGYTLVQLIETSNICAHFVEETNDIYLDVFSCKEFNHDDVKDIVNYYFYPSQMKDVFMIRDASMKNELSPKTPELK